VRLAAKKGFPDISVDLIFGVWGQEPGSWEDELEEAVKLPVGHISAYALTHEKDVPLFEALKNKSVTPLEEDVVAAMYEVAIDKLALRGFKQYEISNFTKDLRRCRHNLNYWDNSPYLGLGASAVSYIDGVRTRNISDAAGYAAGVYAGRTIAESSEKLSPVRRAKETAAIKIRTKDGIDFGWFKEKTGFDFMKLERDSVAGLVEKGLIRYKKDGSTPVGIALKRKGFLFCDTVSSALL
jgi:oxygen-independent coproporphyrinogen-3 oxidase